MAIRCASTAATLSSGGIWRLLRCAALTAIVVDALGAAASGTVIISEYVEAEGTNQALELFNTGPVAVDLSTLGMSMYLNGGVTPTPVFGPGVISQTLSPGGVFTIAHPGWVLGGPVNMTSSVLTFNGDDAVALYQNSASNFLDVIGQIGFDPGAQWGSGATTTRDADLQRKPSVLTGDVISGDNFVPNLDPTTGEWRGAAVNGHTLGNHDGAFMLIAADFDEDGDVDGDDLTEWKAGFGISGAAVHMDGDANGDANVDGGDFLAWQQQLGSGVPVTPALAAAVPEPTSLSLAAMGLATLLAAGIRQPRHCGLCRC